MMCGHELVPRSPAVLALSKTCIRRYMVASQTMHMRQDALNVSGTSLSIH